MKRIKNLPFAYRILIGCLFVALVPLLLANILMVRIYTSTLENQNTASSYRQIADLEQKIEELFENYSEIMGRILENPAISDAFTDKTYGFSTDVNLSLYQASSGLQGSDSLSVYDAGGKLRFSTDSGMAYGSLPVRWGVLKKASRTGGIAYYNIENFNSLISPYALHMAEQLTTTSQVIVGYSVISLSPKTFDSVLKGVSSGMGAVLLLDHVGSPAYYSHNLVEEPELAAIKSAIRAGERSLQFENSNYYISRNERSGFYLVLRQPKPFTDAAIKTMKDIAAATSLISLLLCILFSFLISRSLSKPVRRLSEAMEQAKTGKLHIRVDTGQTDQLGRLAEDFNNMAEELQLYMDKVVRQQREMDESQIRLLQAQLNPHFLYNTLDTVKWLAKINNIPEIASISSDLSIILRQCVSSDDFVTLRQELDMVQSYVDIQRIRFSGKFEYVVSLPEGLADCIVPKLILQPVVENAIIHGLRDKEDGYVYIYAMAEEGILRIMVTDNGCGIEPEMAERLNHPESKILDGHLGLYNVSHILKINYGPEYGLQVRSIPGTGTTLTVNIPLEKEVSQHDEDHRC